MYCSAVYAHQRTPGSQMNNVEIQRHTFYPHVSEGHRGSAHGYIRGLTYSYLDPLQGLYPFIYQF